MVKVYESFVFLAILICFFVLVNFSAASDYYINADTSHEDVTNWMKNDAKRGDDLIFNSSNYKLSDTLVISKSVDIKSFKNTKVTFNKSRNMFNVTCSNVNFTGFNLIHNANYDVVYDTLCTIKASGSYKKINLKNINLTTDMESINIYVDPDRDPNLVCYDYYNGININRWQGNVNNCDIRIKGDYSTNRMVW